MTKAKAGFDLLAIFMSIDGKVEQTEMNIIKEFVEINLDEVDFDEKSEMNQLLSKGINTQLYLFGKVAVDFLNETEPDEREVFIDYVVDIMMSGGNVRVEEMRLALVLGGILQVDVEKIVRDKIARKD